MPEVRKYAPDHPGMSYHSFAAGALAFGVYAAARAALSYGVPIEAALGYLRRYTHEGYVV